MKTETAPITAIAAVTVTLGALTVTITAPGGVLRITSPREIIALCLAGRNPRATLAAWIATLPADTQLDALEAIRSAARMVAPACVSERATLELYPQTTVRI